MSRGYYFVDGALGPEAASYVYRQADDEVYEALVRGETCYVLTPSQTGKTSLMARAAARLIAERVTVARVDLEGIESGLGPEQWYYTSLNQVGEDLGLWPELRAAWAGNASFGPPTRWIKAIREAVLARRPGPVVIFIDEIGVVTKLSFATDEFFTAIRACHQQRRRDPELDRLTFCLLGIATPSELLRNPRTPAFNVGRRVELHDFTAEEAAPLARGLGRADPVAARLLRRILYWTGGHPYLTQRLCLAVAEDPEVQDPSGVDRVCVRRFFTPDARVSEINLQEVERQILKRGDCAGVLELYWRVRTKPVQAWDDEQGPDADVLRISGITRADAGRLVVRNRIYKRVFNRKWIRDNMPDAEARRQVAAFRKGALLVGMAILAVIGVVIPWEYKTRTLSGPWIEAEAQAEAQKFAAPMIALLHAKTNGYREEVFQTIEWKIPAVLKETNRETLRQFAVDCMGDFSGFRPTTIDLPRGPMEAIAVDPEARQWAVGMHGGRSTVNNFPDGREPMPRIEARDGSAAAVFGSTGRNLVRSDEDGTVRVWRGGAAGGWKCARGPGRGLADPLYTAITPDGRYLAVFTRMSSTIWMGDLSEPDPILRRCECPGRQLTCLAFDGGGRRLAMGYCDEQGRHGIAVWGDVDVPRASLGSQWWNEYRLDEIQGAAFSPDGTYLAVCAQGVSVFESPDPGEGARAYRPYFFIDIDQSNGASFSPDSQFLACTGTQLQEVKLWSTATRQQVAVLKHQGSVRSVVFSTDGRTLVVAGPRTIRLWDLARADEKTVLAGHTKGVPSVAFRPPDGKHLVSASKDGTVKVWQLDPPGGRCLQTISGFKGPVQAVAFRPDGRMLAIGDWAGTIQFWDTSSERVDQWQPKLPEIRPVRGQQVWAVGFSGDGQYFAAGGQWGLRIWRVTSQGLVEAAVPVGPPVAMGHAVMGLCFDQINGRSEHLVWAEQVEEHDPLAFNLHLWDLATMKEETPASRLPQPNWGVLSAAFVPGRERLAFVDTDWYIKVVDVVTGETTLSLGPQPKKEVGGSVLALNRAGAWLAVQSGLTAEVWDMNAAKLLFRLPEGRGIVWCLTWSPDWNVLA
ncbi:MAG TPA: AAA-like domain-containing protein, partial [Isosphaeraceae bacterium]